MECSCETETAEALWYVFLCPVPVSICLYKCVGRFVCLSLGISVCVSVYRGNRRSLSISLLLARLVSELVGRSVGRSTCRSANQE